jgi:DNA-binding response OmpR family regulator
MAFFDDGAVHIDFDHRQVTVGGKPVDLTPSLYELLAAFIRHQGQVLSPERLIELAFLGEREALRLGLGSATRAI